MLQEVGDVEYADYTFAKVLEPPPMSILDMTQNYLIVRLRSWSFGEYGESLHCNYFKVHSDLSG